MDIAIPCANARNGMCQSSMVPVMTSIAVIPLAIPVHKCTAVITLRFSNLSTMAPPMAPKDTNPKPCTPAIAPTQNAESVISSTSQPWASMRMPIDIEEKRMLSHNHRNGITSNERKIVGNSRGIIPDSCWGVSFKFIYALLSYSYMRFVNLFLYIIVLVNSY